ncbi:uncharacterized protein [Littorina saxatilis]|uniref:uncharacterized protein n=1 Tax=Littorina saxatilis TaxID=31220 RepID=UPI0038B5E6B0
MEAGDKSEAQDLHVVPALSLPECYVHSSNGSSCSSSNHSIHKTEQVHANGIHSEVGRPTLSPHDCGDILPQCSSQIVASQDTFFREKVDNELQSISDFMHGMLSEQQIHLQQILVNASAHTKSFHSQQETGDVLPSDEEAFSKGAVQGLEPYEEIEMQLSTAESAEKYQRSATSEILLEMMSLACELSALLNQSKYL